MTTPIDLGLFNAFSFILPILLVYAVLVGILTYAKLFNAVINNVMAIVIALMMLFIPSILEIIQFALPWMVLAVLAIIIMLLVAKTFNVKDDDIKHSFTQEGIIMWVIAIFVIIIIASIGKVYFSSGDFLQEGGSAVDAIKEGKGEGELRFWNTIFHPNIMGFVLLMTISVFTVALVSSRPH